MSPDYPFYEELRRQKHRAAGWWRVGDGLYYLGLVLAVVGVATFAVTAAAGLVGFGWRRPLGAAVAAAIGIVTHLGGRAMKRRAYELARQDGIEPR